MQNNRILTNILTNISYPGSFLLCHYTEAKGFLNRVISAYFMLLQGFECFDIVPATVPKQYGLKRELL
jgi:hypothetical protein